MASRDEGFIVVRKFMMKDLKLHGVPLLLYARIHGFTINDGAGCYETYASLAANLDVSTRAIGKAYKVLKDRNLIYTAGIRQLKNGRTVKVYKTVPFRKVVRETNCPEGTKFLEQSSAESGAEQEQTSESSMNKVPPEKKRSANIGESKGGDRFDEYKFRH